MTTIEAYALRVVLLVGAIVVLADLVVTGLTFAHSPTVIDVRCDDRSGLAWEVRYPMREFSSRRGVEVKPGPCERLVIRRAVR